MELKCHFVVMDVHNGMHIVNCYFDRKVVSKISYCFNNETISRISYYFDSKIVSRIKYCMR